MSLCSLNIEFSPHYTYIMFPLLSFFPSHHFPSQPQYISISRGHKVFHNSSPVTLSVLLRFIESIIRPQRDPMEYNEGHYQRFHKKMDFFTHSSLIDFPVCWPQFCVVSICYSIQEQTECTCKELWVVGPRSGNSQADVNLGPPLTRSWSLISVLSELKCHPVYLLIICYQ